MSDDEKPAVISLRSRQAWVPPVTVDPDAIDTGAIMMLQDMIKRIEAGEIKGVAAIAWTPEHSAYENFVAIPLGADLRIEAIKFAGATDLLKDELLNLHLFGELSPDEDDEDGAIS